MLVVVVVVVYFSRLFVCFYIDHFPKMMIEQMPQKRCSTEKQKKPDYSPSCCLFAADVWVFVGSPSSGSVRE